MLIFNGGGVVVLKNKQLPSKTSADARFRWWWGSGVGKQTSAIENEHMRSFSRAVGCTLLLAPKTLVAGEDCG